MEKQVVNGEELDHDPIEHSVELCNIASFQLGVVGGIIGDNFERIFGFKHRGMRDTLSGTENGFTKWT